jgi:hypothetical protein
MIDAKPQTTATAMRQQQVSAAAMGNPSASFDKKVGL